MKEELGALEELERRAYRTFVDDGIADILVGALIVAFGVTMATDVDYLPIVVAVLAVPLWRRLRADLVEPRLGYARLRAERVSKLERSGVTLELVMLLVAGALWLVAFGVGEGFDRVRDFSGLLPGMLLAIPATVGGRLLGLPRLYAYAGVLLLTSVLAFAAEAAAAVGLLASGAIVVGSGLVLLRRFVLRYPEIPGDA